MRISDWSSDVCSSDLAGNDVIRAFAPVVRQYLAQVRRRTICDDQPRVGKLMPQILAEIGVGIDRDQLCVGLQPIKDGLCDGADAGAEFDEHIGPRSEEQTSELQTLMRNSYAVVCLKQKKTPQKK